MRTTAILPSIILSILLIPTFSYAQTAAEIEAQITQLESQKASLMQQRAAIAAQLGSLGFDVGPMQTSTDGATASGSATLDGDKKKEDDDSVYAGKKPDINESDFLEELLHPGADEGDSPPPRMTDDIADLQSKITIGPDGKPRLPVEDVIRFQGDTQMMRDLKNAPAEVREAFNRTLRGDVYRPHDQKLIDHILSLPGNEHLTADDVKIDDFRTPKEGETDDDAMKAINTDRDYRVLVKNDKDEWIEVDTRKWKDQSDMILSETSRIERPKDWADMTPDERKAARDAHQETFKKPDGWDDMNPQEQFEAIKKHQDSFEQPVGWDKMTGAERMEYIKKHHGKLQQMATDKDHAEASRDYSDQEVDEHGNPRQKEEPNILKVKRGETTLLDPDGLGAMYREKVEAALRDGNKPEAIAQLQKGVDSLSHIREGYEMQGYDVGKLPKNLQDAMEVIANAKTDTRANPAEVERKLKDLGFEGGIDEVSSTISSQVAELKNAQQTRIGYAKDKVKKGWGEFKKGAETYGEAKKITEVAVKLADAGYTASHWTSEAEARAGANTQIDRRNQRVDQFYADYDSDPELRRTIDEKVKAGQMKLPNREHVKHMEEAGIGEKLGLTSVRKDAERIALNVLDDVDSINSVLKLAPDAVEVQVGSTFSRSADLARVKGGLDKVAGVAGNIATVVNTGRQLHQVSVESAKTQDALDEESRNVTTANVTLDRYRQTQQRVQSEVSDQHGGDWRAYVASKRSDFGSMTPAQQDALVNKIKSSATKKVEDAEYVGWTTDDIDVLGSVDAGLTNAPVVGGVYSGVKNIGQATYEGAKLGEALYEEQQAENRAHHTRMKVWDTENVTSSNLEATAERYRQRIQDIESGKSQERGLTQQQLEYRLWELERRIEEGE